MTKLPAGWPARTPHPGWACCDPEQDLAAWVAAQREQIAHMRELAAQERKLGKDADARALEATVQSLDAGVRHNAEMSRQLHHGHANGIMQSVLIKEGHLDRLVAAHPWRFTP